MTTVPTVADVAAAGDVLGDIAEVSDSLEPERAVEYRAAIEALIKRGRETLGLLDTGLIRTLESPIIRDGVQYEVSRKKDKKRFDHGRIASGIQKRAMYDDNGERLPPGKRLARAVDLFRKIYLSPSVEAKVTVLDQLGFVRNDVESYELGERYVKTTPVNILQPPTEKANQ